MPDQSPLIESVDRAALRAALRAGDEVLIPNSGRCRFIRVLDDGREGVELETCWTGFRFAYRDCGFDYARFMVAS